MLTSLRIPRGLRERTGGLHTGLVTIGGLKLHWDENESTEALLWSDSDGLSILKGFKLCGGTDILRRPEKMYVLPVEDVLRFAVNARCVEPSPYERS